MSHSVTAQNINAYVGRFAPSPSGPLHFGSLLCALVSFLDARANNGKWLIRIEDIDTPRIDPKFIEIILHSLKAHCLDWDSEVILQSERHELYHQYLNKLNSAELIYGCNCSRKQIRARSQFYDRYCRDKQLPFTQNAVRFKQHCCHNAFFDKFLGKVNITHPIASEDPVLRRADTIYAYHLAVVVDDIEQGVTDIIRGNDLLDTTPIHLALYDAFQTVPPHYGHMPILVQKPNQKLSKQHHSPSIDDSIPLDNLKLALKIIGFDEKIISRSTNINTLLGWAIDKWNSIQMPKKSEILISTTNGVYSYFE